MLISETLSKHSGLISVKSYKMNIDNDFELLNLKLFF